MAPALAEKLQRRLLRAVPIAPRRGLNVFRQQPWPPEQKQSKLPVFRAPMAAKYSFRQAEIGQLSHSLGSNIRQVVTVFGYDPPSTETFLSLMRAVVDAGCRNSAHH
jgi:hypothetical protein